jgi:hypothetical protein
MCLLGVDNRPVAYSQKKADNRLVVHGQIKTIMFSGGVYFGKKIFLFFIFYFVWA